MLEINDTFYRIPKEGEYNIWGDFLKGGRTPGYNDQSSTIDQLRDLYYIAVKIGKYDAAKYLENQLNPKE